MRSWSLIAGAVLILGACTVNEDPAAGGFVSGVAGVTTGSFQARVDALEGEAESERARQASLEAQIAGLERDLTTLKLQLSQQRSGLAASGVGVPAALDQSLNQTLTATPGGQTDAEKLAALQTAISSAESLSAELAGLAS